jgi:hypothetical protein
MRVRLTYIGGAIGLLIGLAALLTILSRPTLAQKEVTSKIYRYRERVATGYYEGYEVSPRRQRALVPVPKIRRGLFPYGSASAMVRIRARQPDSHRGLKFYYRTTCIECHPQQARNIHSVRAGITCRQCHGSEPIAAVNHYYSAMNPIRRHAYVCAKCHEGANAAFAGFYVHEPAGTALSTRESFPVLFYASWGMLLLLLGTLAFFVPHSFMVGVRELFEIKSLENLIKERISPRLKRMKDGTFSIIKRILEGFRKFFEKKKAAENEVEDAP